MMSYAVPMSTEDWKKEEARREKALMQRLSKLPQNELVKEIEEEDDEEEAMMKKHEEWGIVDRLFREACDMYMEDEKPFKEVAKFLGEAISALSK